MSGTEDYDLVIIGSGAAGKLLAWTLAGGGRRVAVVERKYVGGSCPNVACLPSKNVIHSAKVASYLRRGGEFGLAASDRPVDMNAVRERKRRMVHDLVALHVDKFRASGAELIMGTGHFVGPRTVEVALNDGRGTRTVRGRTAVIINTGSRARLDADDTPGLRDARPLTHVEALELDRVPGHLIVLGGGYVGLEFAQAARRFGSRVTVVERNVALLHREDPDVSEAVEALFRDEGIAVVTGATVRRVEGTSGERVRLHVTRAGDPGPDGYGGEGADGAASVFEGTHLLVAAGRTPNTDGIGLDRAGVQVDAHGHVAVNERLQTTADGVWAVGDCAGSPYFTHVAVDDFRVVLDNLPGGNGTGNSPDGAGRPRRVTTGRQVPSCLFTDPELAHVGLTEREAQARGIAYRLARIPMAHVLRAQTLGETRGFMKALIEPGTGRILGFTAFGVEAGEVMPAVQVAMAAGLPYTHLRDMVIAHPTVAEGLGDLFGVPLTDPAPTRGPAWQPQGRAGVQPERVAATADVPLAVS